MYRRASGSFCSTCRVTRTRWPSGDDAGVVRAARGAGAEVRQGLRAGGGGLRGRGRRPAHAALRAAAQHLAAALRRARTAPAHHIPHLQPR